MDFTRHRALSLAIVLGMWSVGEFLTRKLDCPVNLSGLPPMPQ
jgi:hypothetical protein